MVDPDLVYGNTQRAAEARWLSDGPYMSMQSLQNRRYHQEYAYRVAGEILSEYYGGHDAK